MFRNGLLISTAMTAVALLLSPALHAASVQTDMRSTPLDPNSCFVCTYGGFMVSAWSVVSSSYYNFFSGWEHVAVPVKGRGQTVSRIRVIEAQVVRTSSSAFTIGIYSNTVSGLPGEPIAVGTGTIGPSCGPVKVSIPPTTLKPNTRYWIEERIKAAHFKPTYLSWKANPNANRKAYIQTHYYRSGSSWGHSSSTTPWTKQTTGPYLKLK